IAQNGTGKSTLLKILAGREPHDDGKVMFAKGVDIDFLAQEPKLDAALTINEYISQGASNMARLVSNYEEAVRLQAEDFNPETQKAFERASVEMDAAGAWDYEHRLKKILGKLNIHNLKQPIVELSG